MEYGKNARFLFLVHNTFHINALKQRFDVIPNRMINIGLRMKGGKRKCRRNPSMFSNFHFFSFSIICI